MCFWWLWLWFSLGLPLCFYNSAPMMFSQGCVLQITCLQGPHIECNCETQTKSKAISAHPLAPIPSTLPDLLHSLPKQHAHSPQAAFVTTCQSLHLPWSSPQFCLSIKKLILVVSVLSSQLLNLLLHTAHILCGSVLVCIYCYN